MTEPTSTGERIREEREWCGFTRAYVAQALGVTEVIVAAFEDGTAMPTGDQRAQLHLLLGLAPGRLAGRPLREDLPPGTIACGPGPATHEDRYQAARFAEFLRYSSSAPTLPAAIEAVLKHHERQERYERAWSYGGAPVCGHNPDSDDWGADHESDDKGVEVCLDKPLPDWCGTCDEAWPCAEVRAITAALSDPRETPSAAGTTAEEAMADD